MRSRAIWLTAALLIGACRYRLPIDGATHEVVATYGGRTVTVGDTLKRIKQLPPPARAYLTTTERKRGFVENMILTDLLYDEGKALGYATDPSITGQPEDRREPLVVRKVMARYQTAPQISDDELRRYYDANVQRYVHGGKKPRFEQVREPIRVFLTNQRIEDQVREHLESLKRQADLRIREESLAHLDPVAGLTPPPLPPAATGH